MLHRVPVIGTTYYVDGGSLGDNDNSGRSWRTPFATLTYALTQAGDYDKIRVAPVADGYDEAVTIARAKQGLVIEGAGPRGSVFLVPSAVGATPLTNLADDVTLLNLGLETNGAGVGLVNYGRRFRAYESKFEGGATAAQLTMGTQAQIAADTYGDGSDVLLEDCELCWTGDALLLTASDYGALTQVRVRRCLLHNFTSEGVTSSGGSTHLRFRDLLVEECLFRDQEDGTQPSQYLNLNPGDDVGDGAYNTGGVVGNWFPVATASGLVVTATKLIRAGNHYTDGHD